MLDGWAQWFESCGVAPPATERGPRFAHCELVLQAAETAQGVALPYTALIPSELESGRLVQLFDRETPPVVIYSLAYQESDADEAKIRWFRDWIFEEVRAIPAAQLRVVASGGRG